MGFTTEQEGMRIHRDNETSAEALLMVISGGTATVLR